MVTKKALLIAVSVGSCMIMTLLAVTPTWSLTGTDNFDVWTDINGDGAVDIFDAIALAGAFGAEGTPTSRSALVYDSGWFNVTDLAGPYCTVVHNANISCSDAVVDARGRALGWNRTYDVAGYEQQTRMIKTNDGGYAIAGYAWTGGGALGFLLKIDKKGNLQWTKTYQVENDSYDRIFSVFQTEDGGYVLAGDRDMFGFWDTDYWMVRTDSDGNMLWNQTYELGDWENGGSVVQANDGGFLMAGDHYIPGPVFSNDICVMKTDSSGNLQWSKTYGGSDDEFDPYLVKTADGGYAFSAVTWSYGVATQNAWLVKIDADGNMLWNKTYGDGTLNSVANAVIQTIDGGYALAGAIVSPSAGGLNAWMVKTDSNGTQLWATDYGGLGDETAYSVIETNDGGFAFAGETTSYDPSGDYLSIRTDAYGNIQWNSTYGGSGTDIAYSVAQTIDGGYLLSGQSNSFGYGDSDVWVIKTTSESGLTWTSNAPNSIALYKGNPDPDWDEMRVRLWKVR